MPDSLVIRGAENHQTTLEGVQGGLIELSRKVLVLNTTGVSTVRLVSTSPSDLSQVYRIEGVSDFNLKIIDEVQLSGMVEAESIMEFAYIERVTKIGGSPLVGTVSIVADGATIGTLEPEGSGLVEVTDILNLLREVPSNPTLEKTIYEKFFLYNNSSDLVTVDLREFSDPDNCVTFAIDPSTDNASTSMNRELRPITIPFNRFTSLPKVQLLNPGESIGIWIRVRIDGGRLVTSKRYSLSINETIPQLQAGGFGNQNNGVPNNGGQPDNNAVTVAPPFVARLLSRHAGGMGLIQPISIRNSHPLGGGNPLQWIELRGAKIVQELAFEPDPTTFRDRFYYNTRLNQLFRKINSFPRPVWKSAR